MLLQWSNTRHFLTAHSFVPAIVQIVLVLAHPLLDKPENRQRQLACQNFTVEIPSDAPNPA